MEAEACAVRPLAEVCLADVSSFSAQLFFAFCMRGSFMLPDLYPNTPKDFFSEGTITAYQPRLDGLYSYSHVT